MTRSASRTPASPSPETVPAVVALTIALAAVVGVLLGLLGGGGSVLAVPLLVFVAGLDPHSAAAMSLFVVGTTSLAGLVPHARAGRVRWLSGLAFGAAGWGPCLYRCERRRSRYSE